MLKFAKASCTAQMKICRDINLDIEDKHAGGFIKAVAPPNRLHNTHLFLENLFPNSTIEFLASPEMLDLWSWESNGIVYSRTPSRSSLLFQTVHECFSKHYPLALSADVLMNVIIHQIATTVKMHSDHYRDLFTNSAEKQTIAVRDDSLVIGSKNNQWDRVLNGFLTQLQHNMPSDIATHLVPTFSTSTAQSKAASISAFMDVVAPYYAYKVDTLCGIPKIRLLGEADDYVQLLESTRQLSAFFKDHLSLYFKHLIPVLTKIATQAEGASQDDTFWQSIYKYKSMSGSNNFNGWLTAFLNYIQSTKSNVNIPEPAKLVQKPNDTFDWKKMLSKARNNSHYGLDIGSIPIHISKVPFIWNYLGQSKEMLFVGGTLSVTNQDGYVTLALSYGVLDKAST